MKIAYVTPYDANDVHAWSGSGFHILQALRSAGFEVVTIGSLKQGNTFAAKLKKIFYKAFQSKKYLKDREPGLLKSYAMQVEAALSGLEYDLVFIPGSIQIASLQTDKPIVVFADATFAGLLDFYPSFSNLCIESVVNGNKAEQSALSKCRLAIFSSRWAARSAMEHYDVDPEKIKVVPFGANNLCFRTMQDIELITGNKSFDVCRLLFVGVEWHRKGGDVALKVAEELNRRGVRTELHVVGCTAPGDLPDFVIQHGFISKNTEAGRQAIDALMMTSHFLLLPSRAECFGIVFAEASSFGLPSLASNVGGIPTAVHDGKNGQTFALNENPGKYCDLIEELMLSKHKYAQLAQSSFTEYSERLNWNVVGRQLRELIEQHCS